VRWRGFVERKLEAEANNMISLDGSQGQGGGQIPRTHAAITHTFLGTRILLQPVDPVRRKIEVTT